MKKCFKLIGILLSIASLSACQTEDKIIKLDEKGAKATHTYTAAVDGNDLTFGLYFNF